MTDDGFLNALAREAAIHAALLNGDPGPLIRHWADGDDITAFGGVFPATRLSVPVNAAVGDYLRRESVMPHADAAVCHAGHGTTMAALCHGVPLVCIPGLGRDQAPIAARVAELGLGMALS